MDEILRKLIVQELGLEEVQEETANEVITKLGGLILQTIIMRLAERLSTEHMSALKELLMKGDQIAISEFLEKNVENFDQLVEECSRELVDEYKSL